MFDPTKDQLQDIITTQINKEEGLNGLMEMILSALMKTERDVWLSEKASPENKGNGYRPGKAMGYGRKLELRIPRDRLGEFKPVLWTLLKDQHEEVRRLCFELYGKGLTTREVGEITQRVYGQHYSSSAVSQFNQHLSEKLTAWRNRDLQRRYPVLYLDALFQKVRRDTVRSEAFYVVIGLTETMQREVLAIVNIPQESASGWKKVLENLRQRGLEQVDLMVSDGLPGLEDVLSQAFPMARHQKCVTHFKRTIMTELRSEDKSAVAEELRDVFQTGQRTYTASEAITAFKAFAGRWKKRYKKIGRIAEDVNLEYYFTYLDFDYRVQSMIYTTNWIERLNKSFRRSLKIRNALPNPEAGLLIMSKVAVDIEERAYQYPIYNFKFDPTLFPNHAR